MTLDELAHKVVNFDQLGHSDKIKLFAWHLHKKGRTRFDIASIRSCFTELHISPPPNISQLLTGLTNKNKPDILKDKNGYYLEGTTRRTLDAKYEDHVITIAVRQLLTDLPGKIPDEAERKFLTEALVCFNHGAFRASIVMTWNLAFSHLIHWVFINHIAIFNAQIPKNYPRITNPITKLSDFGDNLKESQVIEIVRSCGLISAGIKKILNEKLDKRNTYAHPSLIEVSQLTAEEFIQDLVDNVVLKLK